MSLHKDDNPEVPPSEGGNGERDNMTNGEDDGFHEEEVDMKGRADGRQGVEDVIEPNTDDAIPEESANNTVEEEPWSSYNTCEVYSFTVIPKALQSVMNMETLWWKSCLPVWVNKENGFPSRMDW